MSYNDNQFGNRPNKQKEPKLNYFEGRGIIRARNTDPNAPLVFKPWKSGTGGLINADLVITETFVNNQQQATEKRTSIPISLRTNSKITEQQLRSIQPGMSVRVIGGLKLNSYKSNQTGKMVYSLEVVVNWFEILNAVPAYPTYQQGYQGQQAQNYPPQNYPPQGQQGGYVQQNYPPQQAQNYPPQGQNYPPQGQQAQNYPPQNYPPQGQQGGYVQQNYPPQQAQNYPPQGQQTPQQPTGNNPYAQGRQQPQEQAQYQPYQSAYQPAQRQNQYPPVPAQAQKPAVEEDFDDLPEA